MSMKFALAATAALISPAAAHAAAFQNGSFETLSNGSNTTGVTTFDAPSTAIAGWRISSGDVDYIASDYWQASNGTHSLDMNGFSTGTIEQTFDTIAGTAYNVFFDLSKNPGTSSASLAVSAGAVRQVFTFATANSTGDMQWMTQSFQFVAAGASTRLAFASLEGGSEGAALDNVRVNAVQVTGSVPEPATWAMMMLGFGGMGYAMRRKPKVSSRIRFA